MKEVHTFQDVVKMAIGTSIRSTMVHTLQVIAGHLCDQECRRFHHKAGPHREEVTTEDMMDIMGDDG
jgi:hypothetical protein